MRARRTARSSLVGSSNFLAPVAFDYGHENSLNAFGPALMLRGMAVECFLKGLAVKNGRHRFVDDGKFKPIPGGADHNLRGIARTAGFNVESRSTEEDALRLLTHYIRVGGRYPIAKTWDYGLVDSPVGKVAASGSEVGERAGGWPSSYEAVFKGMIERTGKELGVETRRVAPLWLNPRQSR